MRERESRERWKGRLARSPIFPPSIWPHSSAGRQQARLWHSRKIIIPSGEAAITLCAVKYSAECKAPFRFLCSAYSRLLFPSLPFA